MFGLSEKNIESIREVFSHYNEVDSVIIYGSRAKGNYQNGSDIDLTLLGDNIKLNSCVYNIMEDLDNLDLPYSFDISIFNHIENRDLIEHIKRVGKLFYERSE
ncbi:MAG: hypothetical protein CSA15_03190 [Candidatus Delongbacteria bacterium]|nr:MAG: hypothetical protein CSA15_03190 [Candidatus Delongbacteria bacterium]